MAAIRSNAKAVLIEALGSTDQNDESNIKALRAATHLSIRLTLKLNLVAASEIIIKLIAATVQIGFM
ncbi:hypothetical protein D3C81_2257540 [compost metagenome]